jgi:hypothetical protein
VPEIVRERDLTTASQDGWTVEYLIRRDDGEEVTATVTCSGTAEALAAHHSDLAEVVADRGKERALKMAGSAQAGREASITIECIGEHVLAQHHYAKPLK